MRLFKKCLSLLLSVIMTVSLLPMGVWAEEEASSAVEDGCCDAYEQETEEVPEQQPAPAEQTESAARETAADAEPAATEPGPFQPEEEPAETAPEEEPAAKPEVSVYPWSDLSDDEFIAFICATENTEYITALLTDAESAECIAFVIRLEAIENADERALAEEYLLSLHSREEETEEPVQEDPSAIDGDQAAQDAVPEEERENAPQAEPEPETLPAHSEQPEPAEPVITIEPLKNIPVENGEVKLVCRASFPDESAALSYQWQQLDTGKEYESELARREAWASIPGADGATLTFTDIDEETFAAYESMLYRCVVRTEEDSEISSEARLLPDPVWTAADGAEEAAAEEAVSPAEEDAENLEETAEEAAQNGTAEIPGESFAPAGEPETAEEAADSTAKAASAGDVLSAEEYTVPEEEQAEGAEPEEEPGNAPDTEPAAGGLEEGEKQLQSEPINNKCGDDLIWTLSEYVLTISGTGEMYNYSQNAPAPWSGEWENIAAVQLNSGMTSIGDFAFECCSGLTGVTIPNSVTSIGNFAFYGCKGLTGVTIPNSVTSIGDHAFDYCSRLISLRVPGSVKSIGKSAFAFCSELVEVNLSEGLVHIGEEAFSYCKSLSSVTLPYGVKTIGASAFSFCSTLFRLVIPYSISSVGKTVLYGCDALQSVVYSANEALWADVNVDEDNFYLNLYLGFNDLVSQAGRFGSDFTWVLYTSGLLDIRGKGSMGDFTIDTVPWRKVNSSVTSASVYNGITNIGSYAFCQIWGLTSVTIPDTVTVIGDKAFYLCSALENISLPAGLQSLGANVFADCVKIADITIPNGITVIGEGTFQGCKGLTSLTIPASVRQIEKKAFRYCSGLTSIHVAAGNTKYRAEGNCLISMADSKLILGCSESVIPSGVKSIGEYAFSDCSQTSFDYLGLPDSVTSIAECAFYNCTGLRYIDIGKGLASLAADAFEGCGGITRIEVNAGNTVYRSEGNCLIRKSTNTVVKGCKTSVIPAGIKMIGERAFQSCSGLDVLEIPHGVTSIGDCAFMDCEGLYGVSIPGTVKVIGEGAFYSCTDLCDVTICAGTVKIGDHAFYHCEMLTGIHIPGSVTSIDDWAFRGCNSMTSVEWEYGVKTIGECAFAECSALTAACLPDSVTSLGDRAFYGCGSIEKATVPGSAVSVGSGVFFGCTSLKEVIIGIGVRSIGDEAFRDCAALEEVTVPYGVTSLGNGAFRNCSGLKTISLPVTLQTVGFIAFNKCEALSAAYYPGTPAQWEKIAVLTGNDLITEHLSYEVTVIAEDTARPVKWTLYSDGRLVFSGTGGMQDYARGSMAPWHAYSGGILSVIIDNGVTGIGNWAFYDCGMITSVTIPNSVTSVGRNAFRDCRSLANVKLPDTVLAIGDAAFYGCTALEQINVPAQITQIGEAAFSHCTGLRNVKLPAGLLSIGASAFENCTELEEITIPEKVTAIGDSAFAGCGSLLSVGIPAALTLIGENAFVDCERISTVAFSGNRTEWSALQENSSSGNGDLFGAEDITFKLISSGNCGEKLKWSVSASGVLTISGTGAMYDYTYMDPAPWFANDAAYPVTSLVLKSGVTYLGDNAFYGLRAQKVSIPAGVKAIGEYTFGNASLRSVSLPSSLKTVGESAFAGCDNLAGLTLPSALESLGDYAFCGCSSLSSVTIAINGTQTGTGIFSDCRGLTSVIIGDGVTEIGNSWFAECEKLKNVRMPASVTNIRANAFDGCAALEDVYFAGTADQWDTISIEEGNSSLFTNLNPALTIHCQEEKTYTVLFSANGGTGGTALQSFVYGVAQPLLPNTFTRTGYLFSGWKHGKNVYKDGQTVKNLTKTAGAVVTLEAQWKADTKYPGYEYTIRFNGQGNTGGNTAQKHMRIGTAGALPANGFVKTGFHFVGWAATEGGEAVYKNKQSVKDLILLPENLHQAELELFAVWAPNTYTVCFNGNGGKLANGKNTVYKQKLTCGQQEMLERNRYARTGYTFLGWSTNKKATGATYADAQSAIFDLSLKNGGKVTLYAVWKANTYYVEFRKGAPNAKGVMGTQMLSYGKNARLAGNEFSYPGYTFAGWQCSNGKAYKNKASVKSLCKEGNRYITMTAKWTPNTYKVVFKANGGKGTVPVAATGYADTTKVVIPESGTLSFAGGGFVGWNTKADSTGTWYAPGERTVFNCRNKATVSLYAIWEYNATFCLGTCAGTKIDISIPLALYYNKPRQVVKDGFGNPPGTDGYYIAGWNKSENKAIKGYIQYKAEKVKNVGADATLYAVWKPIKYTIAFDANGGTGTMKKLPMTYGTRKALYGNTFIKEGAVFQGWSLTKDGSAEFTNKQQITAEIAPKKYGQTVTLYAVWSD